MARELAVNVALRNSESGAVETFEAGSNAPAWAEKEITNDAVFAASKAKPKADQ